MTISIELTIEKVKMRVSDATLIVVKMCIIAYFKKLRKRLPAAFFKRRVFLHFLNKFKYSGESESRFVSN